MNHDADFHELVLGAVNARIASPLHRLGDRDLGEIALELIGRFPDMMATHVMVPLIRSVIEVRARDVLGSHLHVADTE